MHIAIIAHNGKKDLLASFVAEHEGTLAWIEIVATAGTAAEIRRRSPRLRVTSVLSGPLGGDAQIAAMVVQGQLDMVVFLRDPLDCHPHEADVQMLLRLCDVHEVPVATNRATAAMLLASCSPESAVRPRARLAAA